MTPEKDRRISLTSPLQKACTYRGLPVSLFTELPRGLVFSETHLTRERCSDGAPLCDQSM